jgi:hypothetical protein
VLRCPAPTGRITGVSRSVEPRVGHVLISRCLPSDESAGRSAESGGAHTRTSVPSARNRTASPISGPSPRPPYIDNNTRTSCPHFRRLWPRPTILRHDPGLAASPPVRYTLRVARSGISLPCLLVVRCGLTPFSRSSPNRRLPSLTVAVAQIGRHPSERPHATPPGSPRSSPGCPAAPTRPSSCAQGSVGVGHVDRAPRMQIHCGMLPSGYAESNGRLDRGFISPVERLLRGRVG